MTHFRYGPVELYLVGFTGEVPSPEVRAALGDLLDTGLVRLLDFLLVTKSNDGAIETIEVDDGGALDLNGASPLASGLIGAEDVESLAEAIAPGSSAALVALELTYQRELAEKLASSGGAVLFSERVGAPIVNALLDTAEEALAEQSVVVEQEEGDSHAHA